MRRDGKFSSVWALFGFVVVVLLVLWLFLRSLSWASCAIYGYQTERNTKYAAFVGCMVQVDGKWFPRNELRVAQ